MLQFTGFSCLIWGPKLKEFVWETTHLRMLTSNKFLRQYIASKTFDKQYEIFVQDKSTTDARNTWCYIPTPFTSNDYTICIAQTFIFHTKYNSMRGDYRHSNRHAPQREAQYAFKDLMTHGILQFALRIAFRCVLHRCKNLDIRCWKLFTIYI